MSVLIAIAIFSVLIVVHEFGHFIAARRAGVKVEQFAVGFGPALLKIKGKETDFLVCLFPLGGFVKLSGDVRSECKGQKYEFFSQPVGVRARIVFFGPFFNLILAFAAFWVVAVIAGFPSSQPLVGGVIKYGFVSSGEFVPEELRRLKEIGAVEEIDRAKYARWVISDVKKSEIKSAEFEQGNGDYFFRIFEKSPKVTRKDKFDKEQFEKLLDKNLVSEKNVRWLVSEEELKNKLDLIDGPNREGILALLRNSKYPAYRAGIREGDLILAINGEKVGSWGKMSGKIRKSRGPITLKVLREGNTIDIKVTPEIVSVKDISGEKEVAVIGITSGSTKGGGWKAFISTVKRMSETAAAVIKGFLFLIIGKIPFKDAVTGPIGIGMLTAKVAKGGFIPLLDFAGVLSLSLSIINLFPFPVLDGGHLLFMMLEKAKGRPVSQKWENIAARASIAVLISFMLFVSYNDIVRISSFGAQISKKQVQELKGKGLIEDIEYEGQYVFWNVYREDELVKKLSGIKDLDSNYVLGIWRNSDRGIKVINE